MSLTGTEALRAARAGTLLTGACLLAFGAAAQPGAGGEYWTKRHQARAYGAFAHLELEVKDFAKARPKVEKLLAESGGTSLVDAKNQVGSERAAYMQWSYVLTPRQNEALMKRLKKLGAAKAESVTPNPQADDSGEVRAKRDRLAAEREAAKPFLDRFPATAAAAGEALAHLDAVARSWEESTEKVLLNLAVSGKAP